jgi:hypothetical protein
MTPVQYCSLYESSMWLSHAAQPPECHKMVTDLHLVFYSGSPLKNAHGRGEHGSGHIFLSPAY